MFYVPSWHPLVKFVCQTINCFPWRPWVNVGIVLPDGARCNPAWRISGHDSPWLQGWYIVWVIALIMCWQAASSLLGRGQLSGTGTWVEQGASAGHLLAPPFSKDCCACNQRFFYPMLWNGAHREKGRYWTQMLYVLLYIQSPCCRAYNLIFILLNILYSLVM